MEKLKKFIIKYHYGFEFLILIALSIFFEISFRLRFNLGFVYKYLFLSQIGNIVIISLLLLFRSNKRRFISHVVFMVFAVGLFITDTCLYHYKQDLFSLGMITDIPNGLKVGIKYNIFAAFPFYYWIIVFAVTGCLGYALYRITMNSPERPRFNKLVKWFVPVAVISMFVISGGITEIIIKTSKTGKIDEPIFDAPQDKRAFVKTFGLNTFRTRDFVHNAYSVILKPLEIERFENLIENITTKTPVKSNKHGLFEDKNLILILCETCEDYAIDEKLTPNLYKIFYGDNSLRFTNMFTSAKLNYTYDAEFTALTSMMYFNNDNYMYTFDHNTYSNALPSVLRDKGYSVNSFHSYKGTFFNRKKMHRSLGFQYYYAMEDMKLSDYKPWWPLDSEMFEQMKDVYAPVGLDQPFFSFILSVTAHGAHDEERTNLAKYYEIIRKDGRFVDREIEFQTILAGMMDLDAGIGIMLEHLEENDLLDDTVITIFADHKNYSSFDVLSKYSPAELEYEHDRIPYAIYHNNLEGQTIDLVTSHYDITPTLLDLFGVEYYQEFYYGQSIFLDETDEYDHKLNIIGFNRWISKDIVYFEKDILYLDEELQELTEEELAEYIRNHQENVLSEVSKFHAFFYLDYFKDHKPYVPFD